MREKLPLVMSEDYGEDEPSAQALLQRHSSLQSEIKAYGSDIQRLNDQADKMIKSASFSVSILHFFKYCGRSFNVRGHARKV